MRRILALILFLAAAQSSWAQSRLVVRLTSPSAVKTVEAAFGGRVIDTLPDGLYLMDVRSLTPMISLPDTVAYYEPNVRLNSNTEGTLIFQVPGTTPPDFYKDQPAFKLIRADAAWTKSRGRGVVIADINSQFDYGHPALAGHLTGGYDFVLNTGTGANLDQSNASFLDQSLTFMNQSSAAFLDQSNAAFLDQSNASFLDQSSASFLDAGNPAKGHGTLCLGILAALAPESQLMPLRVFDDSGQSDLFTIAKAIYWATDHKAQIINMSFGTYGDPKTLRTATSYATRNGVFMVTSAGNQNSLVPQFPAGFGNVNSTAATDLKDVKGRFSNYADYVDLSAPGVNIISAYPGGFYAVVSGTSFASPMVAATAALVESLYPTVGANSIRSYIHRAVPIDARNRGFAKKLGVGRIDMWMSLQPK